MADELLVVSMALSAEDNPAAVYLASLTSPASRRTMHTALNTIAAIVSRGEHTATTLPWGNLRFQHTQAIRTVLVERYKPATANKILSALRGVMEKAYKLGYLTPEEFSKASDIKGVRGNSEADPAGRELSFAELSALAQVCKADTTPAGARDAALLAILYACGLRRSEVVALDVSDYEPKNGKLLIRQAKGRKTRTVYAKHGAQEALEQWLKVRGFTAGPLFMRIGKGNRLTGKRMTTQAVYVILQKRADQAGVKRFSPHDMRRTYAGDMLQGGVDIATVAKLMGHASVTTTARYDRRAEETKEKAAETIKFPF